MSKELVPVTPKDYGVLAESNTGEVLADNLGSSGINRFDLDRIKVPTAGGVTWMVPTLDGEVAEKEIVGIVIGWRDGRVYWEHKMGEGEQTPPDCFSDDCNVGIGSPGGVCAKCPMAQFGTAEVGKGQACKIKRLLLMVRAGSVLPIVLTAPTASVGPIRKYFTRLAAANKKFFHVETGLALEKATNAGGIAYSRIVPRMVRPLDAEAQGKIQLIRDSMIRALSSVSVAATEEVEKA